jgi:peptidoglycan/LPS O-acetylase OafA/YrhL
VANHTLDLSTSVQLPAAERVRGRNTDDSGRIGVLDGMRGLAILLVLFMHLAGPEVDPSILHGSAIERIYGKIAAVGDCGVDLFFVLSGFLITRILLRARATEGALRSFYVRRVLRIFPLYYASLAAAFFVMPALLPVTPAVAHVQANQIWLWLYGGNVATGLFGIWFSGDWLLLTHFWSLAVEEQFYLVWPLLVLWLPPRQLLRVCGFLTISAFALKVALLQTHWKNAAYLLTPCRFDGLSLGAAVAVFSLGAPVARLSRWAMGSIALSGVVLGWLLLAGHSAPWLWWTPASVHTLFSLLFVGLLVLALSSRHGSLQGRFWNLRVLKFFGKYSYGLYVTHYMLRPFYVRWFPPEQLAQRLGGSHLAALLAFGAMAGAISVGVALLSWHGLEKHFLRLKTIYEHRFAIRTRSREVGVPGVVAESPPT